MRTRDATIEANPRTAVRTRESQRRQALRRQADLIADVARRSIRARDWESVKTALERLAQVVDGDCSEPPWSLEAEWETGRVAKITRAWKTSSGGRCRRSVKLVHVE